MGHGAFIFLFTKFLTFADMPGDFLLIALHVFRKISGLGEIEATISTCSSFK